MNTDVNSKDSVSEEGVVENTTQEAVQDEPGSKTDSSLLLKSLQEERELRRKEQEEKKRLEQELQELKSASATEDVISEEGRVLQSQIMSLEGKLRSIEEEKKLIELQSQFPALKDKLNEFNEFRKEYPQVKEEQIAKLFLVEKGLVEEPKKRKGLENRSGGGQVQPQDELTSEEISNLRNNNFQSYRRMLKEGKIK